MRLNSSMKSSKSTFITSVSISGMCGWMRRTSFTREEVVTKTISHFPGHILFPQPHTTLHPHDCKSLEAGIYELCTFASLASNLFGKCQRGGSGYSSVLASIYMGWLKIPCDLYYSNLTLCFIRNHSGFYTSAQPCSQGQELVSCAFFFFFCMSSVRIERIVEKLKLYGQFSRMGEVSQFTCSRELVCNIG